MTAAGTAAAARRRLLGEIGVECCRAHHRVADDPMMLRTDPVRFIDALIRDGRAKNAVLMGVHWARIATRLLPDDQLYDRPMVLWAAGQPIAAQIITPIISATVSDIAHGNRSAPANLACRLAALPLEWTYNVLAGLSQVCCQSLIRIGATCAQLHEMTLVAEHLLGADNAGPALDVAVATIAAGDADGTPLRLAAFDRYAADPRMRSVVLALLVELARVVLCHIRENNRSQAVAVYAPGEDIGALPAPDTVWDAMVSPPHVDPWPDPDNPLWRYGMVHALAAAAAEADAARYAELVAALTEPEHWTHVMVEFGHWLRTEQPVLLEAARNSGLDYP